MRFSSLKYIFSRAYPTYVILANGVRVYPLTTAVTANVTTTTAPAGSVAITSHSTGRGTPFYSDGTKWQVWVTGATTKASGAEVDTGTDDAKFVTAKAIADSAVAITSDIPVKATGAEVNTGTNDAKFVTAKAVADSNIISVAAQTHIADPSGAATDQDDEARAAIVSILDALEAAGIVAGA